MRERLIGKQVESCTLWALQARSEEHLKHPDRWLLFEQHYFCSKACDITALQKMRLALLASIPLASLISSEVLSCAHRADMLLVLEKCQLVPVRIPSLFEQNVLKAVGRTQIEGSYKVYAGKTNWRISWKLYPWSLCKQEVRSNWGTLAGDSYPSSIYLFQSMWRYHRRFV